MAGCFPHLTPFAFNPTNVLTKKYPNNPTSLWLPPAVNADFHAFSMTNQAMGVLHAIAAAATALAVVGKIGMKVTKMQRQNLVEIGLMMVSNWTSLAGLLVPRC